jgi:acetamidase/formamidase
MPAEKQVSDRKTFRPTPTTVHWGFFEGTLRPIGEVEEGEEFTLQSVSAVPTDPEPEKYISAEAAAIYGAGVVRGPGPHLVTGPIAVRGARAGDVLQVNIHDIRLRADYGYNVIDPMHGLFRHVVDDPERVIIKIDRNKGTVTLPGGAVTQARPFFGILAVAPPVGWGRIDSREPQRFGGNIDNKDLVAGSTVFLPVLVDRALLSIGDGHAIQGDGEVDVTAVETSMEGDFTVRLRRDFQRTMPVAATRTHVMTMAFSGDLDECVRVAVATMIDDLVAFCHLSWKDAYRLCSLVGDVRITQVVNKQKGVHFTLPIDVVRQLAGSLPYMPDSGRN